MLKAAHSGRPKLNVSISYFELRNAALKKEKDGDFINAVKLYQQCIKMRPHNSFAYSRLMMLYRKQRKYEDERKIIETAIKTFQSFFKGGRIVSKTVSSLSKKITRATGLSDQRGNIIFNIEPILTWQKRLVFVKKRLNLE